MAKRTHALGTSPAAGGLSSLYESAGNAGHRKPGGGQGEARKRHRTAAAPISTVAEVKPVAAPKAAPAPKSPDASLPAVYRKPARKH